MGGQTSLNLAVALTESGVLERYDVELIGAKMDAIQKAEDRDLFKRVIEDIGLAVPRSQCISHADEGPEVLERLGLPLIIRPSFTLGGSGGSVAYNRREFDEFVARGLMASPHQQVLIEESVLGWKEYELEVMRDLADNVVIVCSIENVDAMGVHTGDSITVAPAQTLSDKEYQAMRDAAIRIIRAIGVETGGSNIQFAVNPDNGDMQVNRDEPASVAQFGAGLEGDRIPDRQDRRQAGRGLYAGRNPQRHHARHPGVVRTDDRLLRRQGAALRL